MTVQTPLRTSLASEFPEGSSHYACPTCFNVHSISVRRARIKPEGSKIWCPSCVKPMEIWVEGGRMVELHTRKSEGGMIVSASRGSDGRLVATEEW